MAINDIMTDKAAVADLAYMTIQPSGSDEWRIHNIHFGGLVKISVYDGSLDIVILESTSDEKTFACTIGIKNADYIRIQNVSGSSINIGYDGIQTK